MIEQFLLKNGLPYSSNLYDIYGDTILRELRKHKVKESEIKTFLNCIIKGNIYIRCSIVYRFSTPRDFEKTTKRLWEEMTTDSINPYTQDELEIFFRLRKLINDKIEIHLDEGGVGDFPPNKETMQRCRDAEIDDRCIDPYGDNKNRSALWNLHRMN